MRSERELLDEIEAWAAGDPNIRMVLLVGSRAEPGREPDPLSDYDIELFVRDSAPFAADGNWVRRFGQVMVRWPLSPRPTGREGWITQLVLYQDGVRIDFQITALPPQASPSLQSGYRVLVDRDGAAARLPAPNPAFYFVKRPAPDAFAGRLNAFWWDVVYVAKALQRGELNYARYMLDGPLRFEILLPLLEWQAGLQHGWTVQGGVYGRWLERLLDEETWQAYTATFAGPAPADHRRAMWAMIALVRRLGRNLGQALGYPYPEQTDRDVSAYIQQIEGMPPLNQIIREHKEKRSMPDKKHATVTWKGDALHFDAQTGSGYSFAMGSPAGPEQGGSPMEFLLAGVAGCTAIDVVHTLRKMRQPVAGVRVEISGLRAEEHPKVYTDVTLRYVVQGAGVERKAVERAVALSHETYCSASAMFEQAGVRMETEIQLED